MKVHIVGNGSLQLIIDPEDAMEKEFLKKLMKQENEITVNNNAPVILGKNLSAGCLVIGQKQTGFSDNLADASKKENL